MNRLILLIGVVLPYWLYAQLPPVGAWRDHLPYSSATQVVQSASGLFCATPYSLFSYNPTTGDLNTLSRAKGLSETGISTIAYDEPTQTLAIAYTNSNVDFIKGSQVYNNNDIKRKNSSGDKTIYRLFFYRDKLYCCTGFGIVVMDPQRNQTLDTYFPGNTVVTGLATDGTLWYVATPEGLKQAPVTSNALNNPQTWQPVGGIGLNTSGCRDIWFADNRLYLLKSDSVLVRQNNNWLPFYSSNRNISRIRIANGNLYVCENQPNTDGRITELKPDGSVLQTISLPDQLKKPNDIIFKDGQYYIADLFGGLRRLANGQLTTIAPNAPFEKSDGAMIFHKNVLYACAGSVNEAWQYQFNPNGFYTFSDGQWRSTSRFFTPALPDTVYDLIAVAAHPTNNDLFLGSYGGGLLRLSNNTITVLKQNSGLQPAVGDPGSYRVAGLVFDAANTLWISNYGAPAPLVVQKNNQEWQSFSPPFLLTENALSQILIDEADQKWIVSPKGNGLICFNHGSSISNTTDDRWRLLRSGRGNGNLPDNTVHCIAKDKNGFLWIGTSRGAAVLTCPETALMADCEATQPVVRQGSFAGALLAGEIVTAIAVDGANRKWMGTRNGVWLISADGDRVITHFTTDNSPLLDNVIRQIAIDPQTGEVFFATFNGTCSFRGTATEGGDRNTDVLVFPNPVPPGYTGLIAIRGLVNNAVVKIIDPNGRLAYQTRALGGQATWNGRTYKGVAVSSGTYLVVVANADNTEKTIAKIFIVR
jgi:hypothetical protein